MFDGFNFWLVTLWFNEASTPFRWEKLWTFDRICKVWKTYFKIEVETVSFTSHCLVLAAMISIFTSSSSRTWSSLLSSIVCDFINSTSDVAMVTKEEIESKFKQKAGTITIERSSPALDGGWRSEYFRQIKLFQAHNWWSLLERYFSCQCERYNYKRTSFRMSVHDPLRWK